MERFREILEEWQSTSLETWNTYSAGRETSLTPNDLLEVNLWLKKQANIPSKKELWNRCKIEELVIEASRRKFWYSVTVALTKTFLALSLVTVAMAILFQYWEWVILFFGLATTACVAFFAKLHFGRKIHNIDILPFLSPKLSDDEKDKSSSAISSLISNQMKLVFRDNMRDPRIVEHRWLEAEYSFLLFTKVELDRKGILLLERHPLGDIYVSIAAEPAAADISANPNHQPVALPSPANEIPATTKLEEQAGDNSKPQKGLRLLNIHLSDIKAVRKTLRKIKNTYPISPLTRDRDITKARAVRMEAIEYISRHPKYWEHRLDKPLPKQCQHHNEELRKIFAQISNPGDTRKNDAPGSKLTQEFLKLQDRTLEKWIKEFLE